MKIDLFKITKTFVQNGPPVVDNVCLSIREGEMISLLGPSGCGKTTILRMIAGLETPSSGRITANDVVFFDSEKRVSLAPHLRNLGMVFQSYALWPHLTVFENVAFPLRIKKTPREERTARVSEVLAKVELDGLEKRRPHELSGGQQQRVALARALVFKPGALLLDEPLSNLDAKLRVQMRRELKALQESLSITMIYVTHDKAEAWDLSHRMAVLDRGKLLQFDTPSSISKNPANEFVHHFIN